MNSFPSPPAQPETTGKYLVLLHEDEVSTGVQAIANSTGVRDFARATDFADHAVTASLLASEDAYVLDDLGVAVVSLNPDQAQSLSAVTTTTQAVMTVEPERVVYALAETEPDFARIQPIPTGFPTSSLNVSADYLKGYRDAVNRLVDQLLSEQPSASFLEQAEPKIDPGLTWGLQLTRANTFGYSGQGIRVAVLDTGFDLTHPDFAGRVITSKSFIEGEDVQDANGHGTHCIGTACGSVSPDISPRYGVAYNAEIFAGKVLSNAGSGSDGGILAGIDWAIANGCQVISMSLGAPVTIEQPYSRVYDQVARRALRRSSLIIAAAGNDSRRPNTVRPVSHPANCPSIMAVAALDIQLKTAFFSNGGLVSQGGKIDIAAPGVNIYSAWPMPARYKSISGTSMATPHVAGIAALLCEATGNKGRALWAELVQRAERLALPSQDVGNGIVQAIDV